MAVLTDRRVPEKNSPPDPERIASKDDVAVLGADLRTEMADLRTELRTDVGAQIHDATAAQTRTIVFGLFGSVTAMAVANIVAAGMLN